MARRIKKKRLIPLSGVVPCFSHTAAALAGLTGKEADEKILKAALADARETLAAVFRALRSDLEADDTARERIVQILTCMGWVGAAYPYAPGKVTGKDVVKALCGEEQTMRKRTKDGRTRGLPKATHAARRRAAEAVASLGSVDEAQRFLADVGGMSAGRETERKIALEAGRRTREADEAGTLEAMPRPAWTPPPGAVPAPLTMVIEVDGKGFPCARKDLKGRRGRDGGAARMRGANAIVIKWCRHVDRDGLPLFEPRVARYRVTGAGGLDLGEQMLALALREGLERAERVEFISDGENELECIFRDCFAKSLPMKAVRVLDAMHACQYVDTLVKALEKDEARAKERSRLLRKRLVETGWVGFEKSYRRIFGTGAEARLGKEDRKTWNYLCKRKDQMDYGRWRKEGLVIGSGSVETACKLLIGAWLSGPGMRWRFQNGLCIAALRAAIRSHLKIAA